MELHFVVAGGVASVAFRVFVLGTGVVAGAATAFGGRDRELYGGAVVVGMGEF